MLSVKSLGTTISRVQHLIPRMLIVRKTVYGNLQKNLYIIFSNTYIYISFVYVCVNFLRFWSTYVLFELQSLERTQSFVAVCFKIASLSGKHPQ